MKTRLRVRRYAGLGTTGVRSWEEDGRNTAAAMPTINSR